MLGSGCGWGAGVGNELELDSNGALLAFLDSSRYSPVEGTKSVFVSCLFYTR
jgi:hypothetical protein